MANGARAAQWDAAHASESESGVPSRLYTDEDPATTIKGLGFKDAHAARTTLRLVQQPGCSYKAYWSVRAMAERARHHASPTPGISAALAIFEEWLRAPPPPPPSAQVDEEMRSRRELAASCANAHARARCADDVEFAKLAASDRRDGLKRLRDAARSRQPFELPATSFVACFGGPGEHGYGTHRCVTAHERGLPLFRCACAFRGRHVVRAPTSACVMGDSFPLANGFVLTFDGGAEPHTTATLQGLVPPGQPSLARFFGAPAAAPRAQAPSSAAAVGAGKRAAAGGVAPAKRQRLPPAPSKPEDPQGAVVPCPACGASVPLHAINVHLDVCLRAEHPRPRGPVTHSVGDVLGEEGKEEQPSPPGPRPQGTGRPRIYTIGHSNHRADDLLALLHAHAVTHLWDVRTVPKSAFAPQYNRDALRGTCEAAGVAYEWHGGALGGKFVAGGVEGRVASAEGAAALAALVARARPRGDQPPQRIALMCSEVRWHDCHRAVLARELVWRHGCAVLHIAPSGHVERHPESVLEAMRRGGGRAPTEKEK